MKVKVSIVRDVIMDIDSPALEEVDKFYRNHSWEDWVNADSSIVDKAITDVEKATGLTAFNDSKECQECICGVYAMDGEAILEW